MAKQIYIVRHGQTDFNRQGIVQGSGVDASLNRLGQLQAEAFYNHFGHLGFDKVYISNLRRTRETVSRFLEHIPYERHDGLNEISWGVYEGKAVNPADKQVFQTLISNWEQGQLDVSLKGGESPNQVAKRQREFMPNLTERAEEEQVLVCTHGRAMRIFLCQLLKVPLNAMNRFPHQNVGLYHLEMTAPGNFRLLKENYTGHMDHI